MAVYKRERQLKNGVRAFWQVIVDLPPDPNDLDKNGKPKRRQRTEAFPTERAAKKREREWLSEIDRGIIIDRSPKTVADVCHLSAVNGPPVVGRMCQPSSPRRHQSVTRECSTCCSPRHT
jgi:hypothetical protein